MPVKESYLQASTVLNCWRQARTVRTMNYPNQDPKRLRRRRVAAGLSQTALAKKANITKSHISSVENGRAGFSPEFLARVAMALDCTIEDLMPDEEATPA